MKRLSWTDSATDFGTFDWEKKQSAMTFQALSPDTAFITLELYLGLATGTAWIDDVQVTAELWQKPAGDAQHTN